MAVGRAFNFSDDSVNVRLPDAPPLAIPPSAIQQNSGLLKGLKPALHLFEIRRIQSSGYQEMHYNGRYASLQPLALTWRLCANVRDWFDQAPKNAPYYFIVIYRLELIYAMVTFLSPSYRNPAICDFSKVLLFDHCIDFISQLHQVLTNPNTLPFITYVDIQRARQVGGRFVETLSQNYDLLLSGIVPEPPPVPPGTREPPLATEDRIYCLARAIRCLSYIRDILHYCVRRWNMRDLLDDFVRESTPLKQRLMHLQEHYPTCYGVSAPAYIPASAMPLPPTTEYHDFNPGYIEPQGPQ
jgi:hypothetical protein